MNNQKSIPFIEKKNPKVNMYSTIKNIVRKEKLSEKSEKNERTVKGMPPKCTVVVIVKLQRIFCVFLIVIFYVLSHMNSSNNA